MSDPMLLWAAYSVPLAGALAFHLHRRRQRECTATSLLKESEESGMTEPASLHPVVDAAQCCGSASCVRACPEGAIGVINGKAQLVNPSVCIGHGACVAACPVEAIKLVYGTSRRGMDIPQVKPNFETNVPGIYIAGELGGMGLVRKAAEQGRQAVDSITRSCSGRQDFDLVIIGAGPAGLAATLGAMEKKLRFVTLEQEDSLGGTVYHYPRNKLVMTQPVVLPLVGKAKLGEISKEALLEFWQGIVDQHQVKIEFGQRVEGVEPGKDGILVRTPDKTYRTSAVLLAIGRRGTPRKLGVPGENQPKVVYRLIDPSQYSGQHVLVVGGGDSAIEAAVALSAETGTTVTLSYRGESFGRVKPKNRTNLDDAGKTGRVRVLLKSQVNCIEKKRVLIECDGRTVEIDNDAVVVCAGGILPMPMLQGMGVIVETKFGTS